MNVEALNILQNLPKGWDWSISFHGHWYHVVISNHGLVHEPVYTNAGMMGSNKKDGLNTPESRDLLACVKAAYDCYEKGEAEHKLKLTA